MPERPYRVLVVEDEPTAARIHAEHVRRVPGFEVAGVVGSLQEARRLLAAQRRPDGRFTVDMVLLDMNLPDGHGLDLLQQLRAAGFRGGVFALTAATDAPVIRRAVALGVVQYLVKPFGFEEFADRLASFRAASALVSGGGRLGSQEEVDAVFRHGFARGREELPKGLGEATLRDVEALLRSEPRLARSAGEVGEALGVSRVTARRYLEHLECGRLVTRRPRHGGRGRPEQEYLWTD
ncbi:response regulator [Micrococcus sp.]|uniref:response regulator n=1 Tax=Micrococcus sp. TaxID=1271 RepID=UPI002A91EF65|nr:response regulator [Micrococcus sp.]MDY6055596.1 response regulator [Micrococcus sp.]